MVSRSSVMTRWCGGGGKGSGVDAGRSSATHPHTLRALQCLALGLERRGDHDLGLLELLHRLVAARRHRCPKRTEEVHPTVVLMGGPAEDLLHVAPHRGAHPGTARQR